MISSRKYQGQKECGAALRSLSVPVSLFHSPFSAIRLLFLSAILTSSIYSNAVTGPDPGSGKKYLTITITPNGEIFIGRDTIYVDKLAAELQNRLWKSWLGTGRMYDSIIVQFSGEVLMGIKGSVLDAIKEGQQKALEEICVEQYKQEYEKLAASRQQKVKKQFPVLFQELHW